MVGMLHIVTYLLCIYLVFKGVEIYQIADMSTGEDRARGMRRGGIMIIASVVIGIVFAIWITQQAAAIGQQTRLP